MAFYVCSAAVIPNTAPRKMKGYQPANCGDPEKEITGLSGREAYGEATRYIEQDPGHNCCTIEADNRVKFWKASAGPVELEEVDNKITFIYSEYLHLQHPESGLLSYCNSALAKLMSGSLQ